jgi:CRISPR-associated protein Csb1
MSTMTLDLLLEAARPGGPSALGAVTRLEPAAGPSALVSPAKYTSRSGATYVYEDRQIDGAFHRTVVLDSRSSVANRIEDAINLAIEDGHPVFSRMPSIRVSYDREGGDPVVLRDTDLPHRAFDAHVRLGTVDGEPVTKHPAYLAARNSVPADAAGLFALSPFSVLFGGWDSSRRTNQARFPSAVVGEIFGVLSDEGPVADLAVHRSGARIDPIGARIQLPTKVAVELAEAQQDELSAKLVEKIRKQKGATVSASNLGLGAIPPGTEALDGIATSQIQRTYSLSFSTLRRLRFGRGAVGDASVRALLAAIALNGMVRNDAELYLRANCHLVEAEAPRIRVSRRGGVFETIDGLDVAEADALLEAAYDRAAADAGLDWHGQSLEVVGNPEVLRGALSNDVDQDA